MSGLATFGGVFLVALIAAVIVVTIAFLAFICGVFLLALFIPGLADFLEALYLVLRLVMRIAPYSDRFFQLLDEVARGLDLSGSVLSEGLDGNPSVSQVLKKAGSDLEALASDLPAALPTLEIPQTHDLWGYLPVSWCINNSLPNPQVVTGFTPVDLLSWLHNRAENSGEHLVDAGTTAADVGDKLHESASALRDLAVLLKFAAGLASAPPPPNSP